MKKENKYPENIWNSAKEEMRNALIMLARGRNTISYTEFVKTIKTITFSHRAPYLSYMLDEISGQEDQQGRGMLSAPVVNKNSGLPGNGFFKLAERRGRDVSDKVRCWRKERDYLYEYWAKN